MENPKTRVKSRKRKRIVIISVLVLAGVAIWGYMRYKHREMPIAVQTEKVARRNLTELVVANGRIQPVLQVVINPEVSGEITDLPVKEGQYVQKGDVLVRIKPDNYIASKNSAYANYQSALASQALSQANLRKAQLEYERFDALYKTKLVSDSQILESKTALDVAQATYESSEHQTEQAKASLARAEDDLSKTTILAPIAGTVTKLRSQRGERVVGTAMMAGTEIMTIADLERMEARVDVGEVDVVLIKVGEKARLEVDAFQDKKFTGKVTEIANAAMGAASSNQPQQSSASQEATKFEVKILITEKEPFRPGMSVTAEVETRSRTNALTVPIMAVTTRTGKQEKAAKEKESKQKEEVQAMPLKTAKKEEAPKADEVVFVVHGDTVKLTKVKTGISDDTYMEVTEGLKEGEEIVSGGYSAVSRLLEDGKKIKKENGPAAAEKKKDKSG
jgi:HlyD family secretion protein